MPKTSETPEMPVLRPIPIRTREAHYIKAIFIWIWEIRKWQLLEDWHDTLRDQTKIVIPADFVFDGASIPRPYRWLLSPVGILLIPALVHDFGYRYNYLLQQDADGSLVDYGKDRGKLYWDRIFKEVAIDTNGFKIINRLAWLALVIGGIFAWWKNQRNAAPRYWEKPAEEPAAETKTLGHETGSAA